MVPTGLIGAVKPNTKAFKQNNLKSAQLLSSEGAQRGETKQKMTSVKSTDWCADSREKVGVLFHSVLEQI